MDRLLRNAFSAFVKHGQLRLTAASGTTYVLGDGTGEPIAARFTTRAAQRAVLFDPELKLGEAYMDGSFVIEQGTIADFLGLIFKGWQHQPRLPWVLSLVASRYLLRKIQQLNRRTRAQRNVAHHYDLDGRLYGIFLDSDRQYSCAYFESSEDALDDAQLAKKRHLAAKLLIERGQRVLDIGSGWGGLAIYLAEMCGAHVTGITLSQEQLAAARGRASERELRGAVQFRLQDYRDVAERYDRIVSVGMFEHVGVQYYDAYFGKIAQALDDDGIAVVHSIGRSGSPGYTNPWIAKYIFPGGYIPALSEVLPAIQRAGLLVTDIEILRLHYAETLKAWRERFLAHRDDIEKLYDPHFVRMWEFYLAASEMAFRDQNMMVFQIQMTKRQGVVPITRNYIPREEQRLRRLENGRRPPFRLAGE